MTDLEKLSQAELLAAMAKATHDHNLAMTELVKRMSQSTRDRLLTADEVAQRMGLRNRQAVYRRARQWPFVVQDGERGMRFSEQGLERYLRSRQGA